MATIKPLPSGKWNVRIRRHGHKLVTKTFILQKDAERWARSIEADMDRGIFVDRSEAEATTLAEALERYRREITVKKKSAYQEIGFISRWLRNDLSKRSLASLKSSDFARYRDDRLSAGLATNSVRLELSLISNLFTVAAQEWGIAVSNPIAAIRKPKGSNARTRRLEGDEDIRLLAACAESKNPFLLPLVTLALESAMRLGEMLSLTWTEIDLDRSVVRKATTKNGEARIIPLTKKAIEALVSIPRAIHTDRVFYIWANRSDSIKHSWATATKKAGLDNFHFHDLRHESISRLFERGMHPIEVASVSGHKSLQMLKRYTHLKAEDLLKKMENNVF